MRRTDIIVFLVGLMAAPTRGWALPETAVDASGSSPISSPMVNASTQHDERTWWELYARGRAQLLEERYAEAAALFEFLETTVSDEERRLLASELAMVARALDDAHQAVRPDQVRTNDELALLDARIVRPGAARHRTFQMGEVGHRQFKTPNAKC